MSWITSEEINNAGYESERSGDGRVYSALGKVAATQASQLINTYSFVDQQPMAGMNYYRIRQYDHDGKFTYSQVKSLHFGNQVFSSKVWPNPACDEVIISMNATTIGNASIQVVNHEGKIMLQHLYEHLDEKTRIDIGDLPPGLYTKMIESASIWEIHKIVVVR